MQIRCSWIEPQTNTRSDQTVNLPVAFGRDLATMQQRKPGTFPRMAIDYDLISSYHCLIEVENNQLVVIDQNSTNGTVVNNIKQQKAVLNDGDILKIGGVEITINIMANPTQKQVIFNFYNANGQQQNRILPPPIALGKDAMTLLDEKAKPNSNIASVQEIKDNSLNDYHALFSIENNQLVVMDKNSKHGTFVNGIKQQKTILQHGDKLQLGNVKGKVTITQNEMIVDINNSQIPPTQPPSPPQQTQPQIQIPPTQPQQIQPPQPKPQPQITIKFYDANGQKISNILTPPIALGRELSYMISKISPDIKPIEINHDSISGYHALIDIENGQLVIKDQNSSNGTFVNDTKLQISLLKNRDNLKLGIVEGTIIITQNEIIIDIHNNQNQPQLQPQPKPQPKPQITIKFYDANGYKTSNILNLPIALGSKLDDMISSDITPVEINHPSISPYHALIDVEHGHLVIKDQNNSSGTFINKQKHQISLLQNKDNLKLGDTVTANITINQNQMIIDIDNTESATTGIKCTKCGKVYPMDARGNNCFSPQCLGTSLNAAPSVIVQSKIIEVKVN